MNMVPLSDFEHELRPMVESFMPDLLPRAIVKSAIRFCKDTNLIVMEGSFLYTEENEQFDMAAKLVSDGFDMNSLTIANVVRIVADGDPLYIGGDYSEQGRGTITLFDAYDDVTITVSLMPVRSATQLPSELFDDWLEAILAASASHLYLLPENVDPSAAAIHEREYIEQMRKAKRWREESFSHIPFSPKSRQREFY